MNLREKIEYLMNRNHIATKADLARALDIPYTTIDNILKREHFENVKFSTLQKLCDYFQVDLRYLIKDEITDPNYGLEAPQPAALAADEQQLIEDYRSLNEQGQEYIRQTMYMAKQTYKKIPDLSGMEKQA